MCSGRKRKGTTTGRKTERDGDRNDEERERSKGGEEDGGRPMSMKEMEEADASSHVVETGRKKREGKRYGSRDSVKRKGDGHRRRVKREPIAAEGGIKRVT